MIRDWDAWPWMVAEQAGTLTSYRLERAVRRYQALLQEAYIPALRAANATFARLARATVRLAAESR